jgi:hypothetical protein
MSVRRPRLAALLIGLLFVATETFAFAPQLHGCLSTTLSQPSKASLSAAAQGTTSTPSLSPSTNASTQDECPVCRIASLVMVAQNGSPLALPLPRSCEVAGASVQHDSWLTLDSTCSRAPPQQ